MRGLLPPALGGVFLASVLLNFLHWGGGAPGTAPPDGCAECLPLDGLDLQPAQVESLRAIGRRCEERDAAIRRDVEAARAELRALLADPQARPEALLQAAEVLADLQGQSVLNCVESIVEMRGLLGAEQCRLLPDCCGTECGVAEE